MMRTTAILVAVAMLAAVVPATDADPLTDLGAKERYLVGFHGYPDLVPGDVYHGSLVVEVNNPLKYVVVETLTPGYLKQQALRDDGVRYIEWDHSDFELHLTPNDPLHTHVALWGTHRVGAPAAWDVTTGSTAIKVAHLDSGLNKDHEEFAGQSRVLQGFDFRNGDNDPEDVSSCNWHGTHTTGTTGATMNNGKGFAGLSQHTILPVKIFAGGFFGCGTTLSAITNALQYAGDQGAHLSSNSWGGGGSDSAINDAIAYAHSKGTIHVASAGNSGPCSNCVGQPWKDNPSITIVVSALTNGDIFADYSSQGPEVDIIAPGTDVGSSTSGTADYHFMSGTSMAAPHVTGSLALYMAATGNTAYSTVDNALKSTAENLGFASDRQGAGLVRADLLVGSGGGGGTNSPPTASFTFSCSGLTCDFDGSGSSDPDGSIASYAWDFGDGTTGSGATVSHTYSAGNTYTVTLTVTDNEGATGSTSDAVTVSDGGGGGGITLSVSGYKVKGTKHGDLTWSGATSTNMDVYRDGSLVTTTANDGFYTDNTGAKGGGSTTWRVCEAGTSTCSNDATWNW